ncbi:arginine--tRNA ligase [Caldisphaera sp.]|uniref:arginine--tRNA ligase n=1 Tax=Caldisphaera sp. TaxID=2060322 RepID=UPI0025BC86D9|nr:arginine--tRNA ligase [Caldisphaera sp.]
MDNPFVKTIDIIAETISNELKVNQEEVFRFLMEPVKEEYADFSFPIKRFLNKPEDLIFKIYNNLDSNNLKLVDIEPVSGFLNFKFKEERLFEKIIDYVKNGGVIKTKKSDKQLTIVVEHTSANPIHPLHMGHTRNTCIGDTLSRLLSARGHKVNRRFYIDDMGRQVVIAALGFKIINENPLELSKKVNIKPDKLVGWIYAVSSTTLDALEAKKKNNMEEAEKLAAVLTKLKSQDPSNLFDKLFSGLSSLSDPEKEISNIMLNYEKGLDPEKSLIRSMTKSVLNGFMDTLNKLDINFDNWDWESDIVWNGLVDNVINLAKNNKYFTKFKDADALDIPSIINELVKNDQQISKIINLPKGFELPPLILRRSDGSTLYTTRDIAYSIYKFNETKADKVINVIGADQRLPQLQIRLALLGLGFKKEALNLIHYDYEIVRLPGKSMHGRRGEYVTLDEVIEDIKNKAVEELKNRNPNISNDSANEIAEKIAVGTLRFSMVQLNSMKPLTFDISKAINLKENSGPYLQYTYVRALNILEKHGKINYDAIKNDTINHKLRRSMLIKALKFPLIAAKAADDLSPEDLVSYLVSLSDQFNQWYENDSVIRENDYGIKEGKALLVELVKNTLDEGLYLLGIPRLNKI